MGSEEPKGRCCCCIVDIDINFFHVCIRNILNCPSISRILRKITAEYIAIAIVELMIIDYIFRQNSQRRFGRSTKR